MKQFLQNLIARKRQDLDALRQRSNASQSLDEVRSIGTQMESVQEEIRQAEQQLATIEAQERQAGSPAFNPAAATTVVAQVDMGQARSQNEDPRSTMQYRQAFMDYVQTGVRSSILQVEQRASQGTLADLGQEFIMIPTTVIQQIMTGVQKVYGQLYSRVRKTNIRGGVKYPIGSFSASFNRITESTVSNRQHAGEITGSISFTYYIGEIRLARTLLQSILTVEAFEAEYAKVIVEAYVKAMDKEIMIGAPSSNQMTGILTNHADGIQRIADDHIIEFNATEMADWKTWQTKLFAKIPLSMRGLNPEFVMTPNTYEANIKTLTDNNNRPVYNETYNPVDGTERATFKGKGVVFVEEDILGNFNDIDVTEDSTDSPYFGIYWVPEQAYAINTNLEFYITEYFDQETNQKVKKALVINDGKILDSNYIYLLKKVATETE